MSRTEKQSRNWFQTLPAVWKVAGGLATALVTALTLYAYLMPRVSVSPGNNLNNYDPFSAPLVVTNDGSLSIYEVRLDCDVERLVSSDGTIRMGNVQFINSLADHADDEIARDGSSGHFCGLGITDPNGFKEADVIANVSFKTSYVPWRFKRRFRFRGYMGDNHILRLVPYAPMPG